MHAIGVGDRPFFIEEQWKWVFSLLNVLFAFEPSVNLLGNDEQNGRVALLELRISRLELSQLLVAVGSPGSSDEDDYQPFPTII
jgi:hypothetical protein